MLHLAIVHVHVEKRVVFKTDLGMHAAVAIGMAKLHVKGVA